MRLFVLALVITLTNLASVSSVLLNVTDGVTKFATLRGTEETSANTGRTYYAFRAVHYAEAPTPATRFLPPVPKAPYPQNEIVNALVNNAGCTQAAGIGLEDCLTLNVFTPKDNTGRLPVMFWIHGGAFSLGQVLEYIPHRYMEKDMVIVAIQYRLGPLGFLCFDTDDVPGNAAIFDQIEALRWVQKYIRSFGGDPNRVTIAGESAGSASVSLLLLAPQARGLFHQSISESGSVLAEWAIDSGDRGKIASIEVARRAGCPIDNYAAMLNCVRTVEADVLTQAYFDYSDDDMKNGGLGFSASNPVIQKAGAQRIIERSPSALLAEGSFTKVPGLWGANKQEGTLVLGLLYTSYLVPNNLVNNASYLATGAIPDILKALHIDDPTGEKAKELETKYMKGAVMGDFQSMTPGLTDLTSVLFLKEPTYQYAQIAAQYSPNYFYSFNFLGKNSMFNIFFANPETKPPIPHGVSHADELIYLWVYPTPEQRKGRQFNATEQILSDQMIQVWSNFVINGAPNPTASNGVPAFPAYKPLDQYYMAIDQTWEVKQDYTLTYTVTVDELPKPFGKAIDVKGRFNRRQH